jgi:hypothetical protein
MVRRCAVVRNRRGVGRTGCLVWLLVIAAVAYFAVEVGTVYFRYWRLLDEMKTQAQFAPSLTDETIRRRILTKIEELQLPAEARRGLVIRRTVRPREIRIFTTYQETVELPFFTRVLTLNPDVRERL